MKRLLLLIFAIVSINFGYAQSAAKYKAMFICSFTKEIEWPASEKTGDFVICIVNQNDVLSQVRTFTNGKMVGTSPISVVGVKSIDEISKCHILFLPFADSKADKISSVIEKVGDSSSTLILSDRPGALKNGSCINFFLVDDKLKYEINKKAIDDRKLHVSTKLITGAASAE